MDDICIVKELYRILYRFEKDFSRQNNVSLNEAMVLCFLKNGKPQKAGDIRKFTGLSNSRISIVLSEMESKKLIVRALSGEDRRVMLFELTAAGKRKINQIQKEPQHLADLVRHVAGKCDGF